METALTKVLSQEMNRVVLCLQEGFLEEEAFELSLGR